VLLVHGTFTREDENYGWNIARTLQARGIDTCGIRLPNRSLDDIQMQAEFVVYAIREINARTGKPVDVLGHSQGGLQPRWAIKWWPDIRDIVDDLVTMAAPHHGTDLAAAGFEPQGCFASCWQMRPGSSFLEALNAEDETPGEISYTALYSATDELVQPPETAALDGARNILMQDVCPGRPVEHAGFAVDAAVLAYVWDALTKPGPASADLGLEACMGAVHEGVDPVTMIEIGRNQLTGDGELPAWTRHDEEPPLRDYAR
jgi:hypothetical protein